MGLIYQQLLHFSCYFFYGREVYIKNIWFERNTHGWGWHPSSWQGRLVLFLTSPTTRSQHIFCAVDRDTSRKTSQKQKNMTYVMFFCWSQMSKNRLK